MPKRKSKKAISEVPSNATVLLLFGTIADTTWRMFVPIIGLVGLGVWMDNTVGTKPWLTVGGTIVGVIIATVLVVHQVNKINRNEE